MRLIHIFNDDKFIDSAIGLFELVVPNQSEYFILSPTKSFKYVKSEHVTAISISDKTGAKIFADTVDEDCIVLFHALCSTKQIIALELKAPIISVWFIWGYDLYGQWPRFKMNLYESHTRKFMNKGKSYRILRDKLKFNNLTENVYFKGRGENFFYKKIDNWYNSQFYEAAKKIDIVVPIVPTEIELITSMGLSPAFAPFTYGCIEWLNNGIKVQENASDFLVGNSADPSNNHVDIFLIIAKLNLDKRRVYVPLSYGGDKKYVDFVLEQGSVILGDKFHPILNFMPLDEYNNIVSKCGFVFLYHKRQQALGNILSSLQMGAKVFLHSKSPICKYFLTLGIEVGISNHLTNKGIKVLDDIQKRRNVELLKEHYSLSAVMQKVEHLINIIVLKKNE